MRTLSHVVLSLGGCEAMCTLSCPLYASDLSTSDTDLGHFGPVPIRMAWFACTFPCLLLCYAGQCALLLTAPPAAGGSVFFADLPATVFWPLLLLAVVASLSASQGVLSGCFTLAAQAVRLHYLPELQILHTSPKQYGQVCISV